LGPFGLLGDLMRSNGLLVIILTFVWPVTMGATVISFFGPSREFSFQGFLHAFIFSLPALITTFYLLREVYLGLKQSSKRHQKEIEVHSKKGFND
jgi:hypothetical protein